MDRWERSAATLADWVRAGRLRYEEDILDEPEACPDALAGLYCGENRGKALIRI
jgi:NADPH-dependent curcumin reductase CurA